MGGKSGGDKTQQTQTATSEPWKAYQPYLTDFFGQAQQAYRAGGPNYAPFQTVAGFSNQQQQAMAQTEQRAQGAAHEGALSNYLTSSLSGQRSADPSVLGFSLNNLGQIAGGGSNPWLDQTYNQAAGRLNQSFNEGVVPGLQATFGGAGRSNSGLQAAAFGQASRELGDQQNRLATNIYGGAYEQDAARRLQASQSLADIYGTGQAEMARSASLAPGLSSLQWGNIDRLAGVGGAVQNQSQRLLDEQKARYDFYQNRPYQNLNQYQDWLALGAGQGSSSNSQVQAPGGSRLGGALGGALTGASLGSAIPGIGTTIGAIGGGLLGLFG